jgi:hypothetical protein
VIKVNTDDPKELANQIEATMGCQPDVSIECSAVDFSFRTAIYVSKILFYVHVSFAAFFYFKIFIFH